MFETPIIYRFEALWSLIFTVKYYTPLPWIRLADYLHPSLGRMKVVLNDIPKPNTKCIAQLFFGTGDQAINDPYRLLETNLAFSFRERNCIQVFQKADGFAQKPGFFVLSPAQIDTLLSLVADLTIEIKSMGAITPASRPAKLRGELSRLEDGKEAMHFVPVSGSGKVLKEPLVLGYETAWFFDHQLVLHKLEPSLLPLEVQTLMHSPPLPLEALQAEDAQGTYQNIAALGIDLSCLNQAASKPEQTPPIMLRAILSPGPFLQQISLRLHLVTELSFSGHTDEVEIPSRGALPPVFPLTIGDTLQLIKRPSAQEEKARQILFSLGAIAASAHRGFHVSGQKALDVLAKIAHRDGIPDWLIVDEDLLPHTVKLPEIPTLKLVPLTAMGFEQLSVEIDLGPEAQDLKLSFENLAKAAEQGSYAMLAGDDTIVSFAPGTGKTIAQLAEILDLPFASSSRHVSFAEAALLFRAFQNQVSLHCDDGLRTRLQQFIPEVLPEDQLLPAGLQTALRPYQHDAVAWMSQLHRVGLGRLLADDMGLGKTVMVLTLLAKLKEQEGQKPTLVVAPTSVIDVWIDETKKHVPGLTAVKWHGLTRQDKLSELKSADIVVTSYALLRLDVTNTLSSIPFRYLIIDEAQNIKNPRTESWKAARLIHAEQRIALSGTPIENRVDDLWSILELVAPGVLGSESNFQKRYAAPIAKGNAERVGELRQRVRPIILRRKKSDVESDLPPKIENILKCEMLPEQASLYRAVLEATRRELSTSLHGNVDNKSRLPLLAALTRLRQACCDPRLLPGHEGSQIPSAKGALLVEVLKECLSMGRRIIIYSQFVKMQHIIHDILKQSGVQNALWLHGGTKDRAEVVRQFQDPDGPPVIVVSLKAGGTGLTLTAADTVIYYDPWWNPAVEDQAADRAHRIGQTKAVHLIKLICQNSIEEQIMALSKRKRDAADDVLTADRPGLRSLTMAEIQSLLAAEIDRVTSSGTL